MFQLTELTTVRCDSFNTRIERHGDVPVLAVDVTCTLKTSSKILNLINPRLRSGHYCNRTAAEKARIAEEAGQTAMDLPVVDDLPNIAMPELKYPQKLEREYSGHECRIPHGIDDTTAIVLRVCKVKLKEFTPIEGGSVELKFTVSSSADIDEHVTAAMPPKQQTDIQMLLTASVDRDTQQAVIDASKDGDAPGTGKKAKKTKDATQADAATEGFIAAHGAGAGDGTPAATTAH